MRWFALGFALAAALTAAPPIQLSVDASDVTRRLLHASLTLPVSAGSLRLAYPKWIPGEHAPTGPITDVVNLKVSANGKTLAWRRDGSDVFVIVVDVPAGVTSLLITYDFVSPPEMGGFSGGASATQQLAVLSWNQLLLYPAGAASDGVEFKATLKVPAGWRYGTALPIAQEKGDSIEFQPASLTTLVDSPVSMGRHFKTVDLSPGQMPPHFLNLAADSEAALQASAQRLDLYKQLVAEAGALYASHHYRDYHFLFTLSDHVAHFGLEHHESSDNRVPEMTLVDNDLFRVNADLLSHEMTHSWNGKFRRPAGLATGNYQTPMQGELLWVYEGLTQYLGEVLAARSGLWSGEDYRDALAVTAATMDITGGRQWRPLADTAVAAQLLYGARNDYANLRRGVDYYPEGALIWLEADTLIRQRSKGARSLDLFVQRFYGGTENKPEVKPYRVEDIYAALQAIEPYDWRGFFEQRVYRTTERAPLGGITNGGYALVYREEPTVYFKSLEVAHKVVDASFSLGVVVDEEGTIRDVVAGSPADRAGVTPATKLLAVNGRQFDRASLRAAIRAAKESAEPIELLVKDGEFYRSYRADCHTGERFPALRRESDHEDLLSGIIASKTAQ